MSLQLSEGKRYTGYDYYSSFITSVFPIPQLLTCFLPKPIFGKIEHLCWQGLKLFCERFNYSLNYFNRYTDRTKHSLESRTNIERLHFKGKKLKLYQLGLNIFYEIHGVLAGRFFHLLKKYLLKAYYVLDILQGREDIIINILCDFMKLTDCWGKGTKKS